MTYDDWKTDPDYDEESAKAFMRRMLGRPVQDDQDRDPPEPHDCQD